MSKKVKNKLDSAGNPPLLKDYDVYMKIKSAKKPKSGTPSDIPRELIQEFSPEIATPLAKIYNQMFSSGEWPNHWKLEHVVPIGKVTCPQTEDDLRPISLTPFFSKVAEHFVVGWLLNYVGDKIDHRQYGGLKGNGTTHYLIEFLNFILQHLDDNNQIAVLACFVDFQKAFNRQDHNLLIEKLSDLDVPGWLLRIVVAFLSNRSMVVNYKGCQSSVKPLPGGGPQGTILALLLFLILINDMGFSNQMKDDAVAKNLKEIHLKFVDDLSIAESIDLQKILLKVPDNVRTLPDTYQDRTCHILPHTESKVYHQLQEVKRYANENSMKINLNKTQLMTFNPCKTIDFSPQFVLDDQPIMAVKEKRLLGLTIRSDLKWSSHISYMLSRAYKRLWIFLVLLKKLYSKSISNRQDLF